jgi:hypothetical protein
MGVEKILVKEIQVIIMNNTKFEINCFYIGGPLVTSGSGNGDTAGQNYELIGLVSWGSGCARADSPGVYSTSRVSKQLDWISTTTSSGWSTCPRT